MKFIEIFIILKKEFDSPLSYNCNLYLKTVLLLLGIEDVSDFNFRQFETHNFNIVIIGIERSLKLIKSNCKSTKEIFIMKSVVAILVSN